MYHFSKAISQRAYSLDDALSIGLEEAAQHTIIPRFKCLNTIMQEELSLSTYLCAANNNELKLSSLGGASGFTQLAKVKALFESLEKSIGFKISHHRLINNLHFFSTKTCPSAQFLLDKQLMPKLLLQEYYQNNNYPWLELAHCQQATQKIYYPLGLIYPFISQLNREREDYLGELSNDTGLAIGATPEEAIIHGINQWVERDAYSLFLLKTLINRNPIPARLVLKETLPTHIRQIIAAIETHFKENLIIMDITSDLTIPSFVVSFTQQNMPLQPQGFGASLAKEAALSQALFEAVQYKDRFNQHAKAYREESVVFFSKSPLLLKAMIGDLKRLVNEQQYQAVAWNTIASYPLQDNLKEQIRLMVNLLAKQGANIYTTILYQSSTGVAITYSFIPELENFSLIRDAKFIPLKERGLGVIHAA